MPRGSKPGERRHGRNKGTPNKITRDGALRQCPRPSGKLHQLVESSWGAFGGDRLPAAAVCGGPELAVHHRRFEKIEGFQTCHEAASARDLAERRECPTRSREICARPFWRLSARSVASST